LYNALPMTHKPRLLVHTSRQPIRWADMDMLGHVNNVRYLDYVAEAREAESPEPLRKRNVFAPAEYATFV